ncbi:sterol desaturase family protein [Mesorhizobium sp.]|uniref:sterol desaturase family protein n=1 Tax=Mesorhizobium sp. TaxID=1871066 RepID=UPI000FE9C927|nr:sterol desaturase family protein [Mesorhizobium sp.]RWA99470.1 MAG: sterol desaturase family protein [Mesorhizobium sp.]
MAEFVDWKAIVIVFFIFLPIEHLVPMHDGRRYWRQGMATDLLHFFVTGLVFKVAFMAVLAVAMAGFTWGVPAEVGEAVGAQPVWLQTLEIIVVADLGFYASHRLMHRIPWLWKFHSIHHSIVELDALAAHRVHPLDQLFLKSASLLPVYALGFGVLPIVIANLIYYWQALIIHSNIRVGFGPLDRIIASPRFHHWHHAKERAAVDKNFAGQLSFLDVVFGTMYMPERMPSTYGTSEPVPELYHEQLAYPFRRSKKEAGALSQSEASK